MSTKLFGKEQSMCYLALAGLTVAGMFTDKIPIQVNVCIHSVLIIAIGSSKSLEEMLRIMKKIHVDKNYEGEAGIEQMSFNDAWQFPIVAGFSLCGLYFSMQYFGKDAVNYFLLCYIAVGGAAGIKAMLTSFVGNMFDEYDKENVVNISIKMIGLEIQATQFDLLCLLISCIQMLLYFLYKNWVFNNMMALIFCIHAL